MSGESVDSKKISDSNAFSESSKPMKYHAYLTVPIDDLSYDMNHLKRGKCLIFNHQNFDKSTKLPERRGSDVDASALGKCFRDLDFQIGLYNDKSCHEIGDILKSVSDEDHHDNDCILICVLTHGDSNDVLWSRDEKYNTEKLFSYFTGDRCPSLAGKPKIFIIQACRGGNYDTGMSINIIDETDGNDCYRIPKHADFLVVYSTPPGIRLPITRTPDSVKTRPSNLEASGHFSFRNPNTGSYFIQTLVSVLNHYTHEFYVDLITLLTITNKDVAYYFESNVPDNLKVHKKKQMPCITSMLTRLVFIVPKLKRMIETNV